MLQQGRRLLGQTAVLRSTCTAAWHAPGATAVVVSPDAGNCTSSCAGPPLASGPITAAAPPSLANLLQHVTQAIPSLLQDFIWWAVPKKKVSKHRRGLRRQHQYLKPVTQVSVCQECGRVLHVMAIPKRCKHEDCPAKYVVQPVKQAAAGEEQQPPDSVQ